MQFSSQPYNDRPPIRLDRESLRFDVNATGLFREIHNPVLDYSGMLIPRQWNERLYIHDENMFRQLSKGLMFGVFALIAKYKIIPTREYLPNTFSYLRLRSNDTKIEIVVSLNHDTRLVRFEVACRGLRNAEEHSLVDFVKDAPERYMDLCKSAFGALTSTFSYANLTDPGRSPLDYMQAGPSRYDARPVTPKEASKADEDTQEYLKVKKFTEVKINLNVFDDV